MTVVAFHGSVHCGCGSALCEVEGMAVGLSRRLAPLRGFGVPIQHIHITLVLRLRFMSLVCEEVGVCNPFAGHHAGGPCAAAIVRAHLHRTCR
jgi:hypothetical protein